MQWSARHDPGGVALAGITVPPLEVLGCSYQLEHLAITYHFEVLLRGSSEVEQTAAAFYRQEN